MFATINIIMNVFYSMKKTQWGITDKSSGELHTAELVF